MLKYIAFVTLSLTTATLLAAIMAGCSDQPSAVEPGQQTMLAPASYMIPAILTPFGVPWDSTDDGLVVAVPAETAAKTDAIVPVLGVIQVSLPLSPGEVEIYYGARDGQPPEQMLDALTLGFQDALKRDGVEPDTTIYVDPISGDRTIVIAATDGAVAVVAGTPDGASLIMGPPIPPLEYPMLLIRVTGNEGLTPDEVEAAFGGLGKDWIGAIKLAGSIESEPSPDADIDPPAIDDLACDPVNHAVNVDPADYAEGFTIAFTEDLSYVEITSTSPELMYVAELSPDLKVLEVTLIGGSELPYGSDVVVNLIAIDFAANPAELKYSFTTKAYDPPPVTHE